MKHRLTIFLALFALLSSCTKEYVPADCAAPVAEQTAEEEGYAVSVEQALASLDNELAMIYGDDETRAIEPRRRIKAVYSVASDRVAAVTRSMELPDDIGDLFYIAEFADGHGSAVLGADKRVEPVVAILDETVLTPEDFATADIASDDITSYMTALMINSAIDSGLRIKDSNDWSKPLPIDKFWGPGRDTVFYKQAPLLKTKWHQWSPYNNLYPTYLSDRYPAGCGVIAVAQILAHNKYPNALTIRGINVDWNVLDRFRRGYFSQSDSDKEHIAAVIYNIGKLMKMKNQVILSNGSKNAVTKTNISGAVSALQQCGYKSVSSLGYSTVTARNMVYLNQLPIFIRGQEYNKDNSGHAWVIDGWNEYIVRYWNCYYDTHGGTDMTIIERELLDTRAYTKIHCNFGWGGQCDGYYSENLFDTTKRLNSSDIDTSVGDYGSTAGYIFNHNIQIIKYSLQ